LINIEKLFELRSDVLSSPRVTVHGETLAGTHLHRGQAISDIVAADPALFDLRLPQLSPNRRRVTDPSPSVSRGAVWKGPVHPCLPEQSTQCELLYDDIKFLSLGIGQGRATR
jgi:hypothetical protein